jgi:RNA polymerase-interacting CarD/CdnL/TRCF family regulator
VSTRFQRGDRAFLASAGVVVVDGFAAQGEGGRPAPLRPGDAPTFYVVSGEDITACVPVDQVARTLRPLVDRPTAERMLEILRAPSPPEVQGGEGLLERGKRVVHSGTPLDHAWFLRELYGLPAPVSDAIAEGMAFVAKLVLGEIAAVIGPERSALEQEMRERYPAASLGTVLRFRPG